jgi:AcrR family transcriptional regulator
MKTSEQRRRYQAPRRAAQAAATRGRIVAAARELFAQQGYGATTLAAVAERAGVAVQTVYATFGSKRAILTALIDAIEVEAELPLLLEQFRAPGVGPREQLALDIGFNRRLWDRGADVVEAIRGAATTEPELADASREGDDRRRAAQGRLVRAWARAGALRPGVTTRRATDIFWTMSGPEVYRLLVVESGWSGNRYEAWLNEMLLAAIFAD